jgi:hypothetical protein
LDEQGRNADERSDGRSEASRSSARSADTAPHLNDRRLPMPMPMPPATTTTTKEKEKIASTAAP